MIPSSPTSEVTSRCGVITPSDAEESVHNSSVDDSGSETVVYSEAETEEEEEELVDPAPVTCDLCGQTFLSVGLPASRYNNIRDTILTKLYSPINQATSLYLPP